MFPSITFLSPLKPRSPYLRLFMLNQNEWAMQDWHLPISVIKESVNNFKNFIFRQEQSYFRLYLTEFEVLRVNFDVCLITVLKYSSARFHVVIKFTLSFNILLFMKMLCFPVVYF